MLTNLVWFQEVVVLLESTKYTVDDAPFRAAYGRVKAGFQKLPTYGYAYTRYI